MEKNYVIKVIALSKYGSIIEQMQKHTPLKELDTRLLPRQKPQTVVDYAIAYYLQNLNIKLLRAFYQNIDKGQLITDFLQILTELEKDDRYLKQKKYKKILKVLLQTSDEVIRFQEFVNLLSDINAPLLFDKIIEYAEYYSVIDEIITVSTEKQPARLHTITCAVEHRLVPPTSKTERAMMNFWQTDCPVPPTTNADKFFEILGKFHPETRFCPERTREFWKTYIQKDPDFQIFICQLEQLTKLLSLS